MLNFTSMWKWISAINFVVMVLSISAVPYSMTSVGVWEYQGRPVQV